jgi:hypothetical protein
MIPFPEEEKENGLQMSEEEWNIKLSLCLSTIWRCIRETDILPHTFYIIALGGSEWSASNSSHFNPDEDLWILDGELISCRARLNFVRGENFLHFLRIKPVLEQSQSL